jgi:hypothetical protein
MVILQSAGLQSLVSDPFRPITQSQYDPSDVASRAEVTHFECECDIHRKRKAKAPSEVNELDYKFNGHY